MFWYVIETKQKSIYYRMVNIFFIFIIAYDNWSCVDFVHVPFMLRIIYPLHFYTRRPLPSYEPNYMFLPYM